MTPRPRNKIPSRDDMRAVLRLAKQEAHEKDVNVSLKASARKRLNWMRDHGLKCNTQTDVVNLLCLREFGSLEPWKDKHESSRA